MILRKDDAIVGFQMDNNGHVCTEHTAHYNKVNCDSDSPAEQVPITRTKITALEKEGKKICCDYCGCQL